MHFIYDYTVDELKKVIKPSFRAVQIFDWIYKKYATTYNSMKNLSIDTQEMLEKEFSIDILSIIKKEKSRDGSIKYLFRLKDGHTIESVFLLMKDKKIDKSSKIIRSEKITFCISSQVGCKIGCNFCFTAKGGFIRNLTAGEIVAQIVKLKHDNLISSDKSINIVYMGMGEPLDNYKNFVKSIQIISDPYGLNIARRRITVSTSGISKKIKMLGEENLGIQLAISLHAVDDKLRTSLIPMNKVYNIESIIDAVKNFPVDQRKKIMFEYLIIKDVNDDINSAQKLVTLLNGINSKVNLIYFNPHEGAEYKRPNTHDVERFQQYLIKKGLICTIRESKGLDISAACGQLKEKQILKNNSYQKK